MTIGWLLFADSNVLIEAVFLPDLSAAAVIRLVAEGTFELITCRPVITDVENAILKKLQSAPKRLNRIIERWEGILKTTRIAILPDPPSQLVQETYELYIAIMRHRADIQILAAALSAKPNVILSGNREHFNDLVAHKCGIRIASCREFIELLYQA